MLKFSIKIIILLMSYSLILTFKLSWRWSSWCRFFNSVEILIIIRPCVWWWTGIFVRTFCFLRILPDIWVSKRCIIWIVCWIICICWSILWLVSIYILSWCWWFHLFLFTWLFNYFFSTFNPLLKLILFLISTILLFNIWCCLYFCYRLILM